MAVFAAMGAAGPGTSAAAGPSCPRIAPFNAGNFHDPTRIDNAMLPLVPGSQLVLDGTVDRGGVPVAHRVVFTVTDLTKTIDGVRTLVIWDVDQEGGQVLEAELAFFAQDDAGNVWNLGEYPEEFLNGTFVGAPSVWIAGIKEAEGGIHMTAAPAKSRKFFLQGFAPDIEFEDCARVVETGAHTSVPFGTFDNVVVTEEKDVFDPAGGLQTKYYAPGVGIVRIGAIGDPQAETLTLTDFVHLSGDALESARQEALRLDQRGYQFSDVYGQTPPAERPPSSAPPSPQPASAVTVQPAAASAVLTTATTRARLTTASARRIVRRALRSRLRRWTITRVSCRLTVAGARCTFSAGRRGMRLRGSGTVTRQTSGRVRYRLTARLVKTGCHPVASRRCSRRAVYSR